MRSAQRRHLDGEHVEAVEQVAAERAAHDGLFEVAMRGGDDAHVAVARHVAADALVTRAPAGRAAASPASAGLMSPISSRNSVPPSAISKRPLRVVMAPVKEPFSWPNSSLSSSSAGMAPQLTATNGRWRRGLAAWMARAAISLPVPDSPRMRTVGIVGRHLLDQPVHGRDCRGNSGGQLNTVILRVRGQRSSLHGARLLALRALMHSIGCTVTPLRLSRVSSRVAVA